MTALPTAAGCNGMTSGSIRNRRDGFRIRQMVVVGLLSALMIAVENVDAQDDSVAGTNVASESITDEGFRPLGGLIPTEKSIAFFRRRVDTQPHDFRNRTILGQLYLRHAKETDDLASYQKAETVLREAVANGPEYTPAKTYLASALQARHQFAEALELAEQVYQAKPNDTLALATIGDCELQLGRYQAAEKSYHELALRVPDTPAVLARLGHLAELQGNLAKAIAALESAADLAISSDQLPDQLAWYQMRLADINCARGRLQVAKQHYQTSLEILPRYAPSMAGLAMVFALQGDTQRSIDLYQEAIDAHGEPPMMAALGDVYQSLGQSDLADSWYDQADDAMAEEAKTAAAAHYREVANFYADHNRKLPEALALARQDLEGRQDIYAYDTLAWALHKNGQNEEAREAIAQAMRLGTRDAKLFYHAAKIYQALGDKEKAREFIREALSINPHFSLLGKSDADSVLH